MEGNGRPKHDGEPVVIGGRDFVIPSLSVKQAKQLFPLVLDLGKPITVGEIPDRNEKMMQILFAAISRNEPDLTREELEDLVSANELTKLVVIVSRQSGFIGRPGPEPAAPPKDPSIGSESMDASSREPAGLSTTSTT